MKSWLLIAAPGGSMVVGVRRSWSGCAAGRPRTGDAPRQGSGSSLNAQSSVSSLTDSALARERKGSRSLSPLQNTQLALELLYPVAERLRAKLVVISCYPFEGGLS